MVQYHKFWCLLSVRLKQSKGKWRFHGWGGHCLHPLQMTCQHVSLSLSSTCLNDPSTGGTVTVTVLILCQWPASRWHCHCPHPLQMTHQQGALSLSSSSANDLPTGGIVTVTVIIPCQWPANRWHCQHYCHCPLSLPMTRQQVALSLSLSSSCLNEPPTGGTVTVTLLTLCQWAAGRWQCRYQSCYPPPPDWPAGGDLTVPTPNHSAINDPQEEGAVRSLSSPSWSTHKLWRCHYLCSSHS